MKTRIVVVSVSCMLLTAAIAPPESNANPVFPSHPTSGSGRSHGGTSNQVDSANLNHNTSQNGNANRLDNNNNNSSAAGIEAGFINTPQNTVNNQSGSNSASNSGNFGGAVRNNTTDQSGNSFNSNVGGVELNVLNVVEPGGTGGIAGPGGAEGALGGGALGGGGTYFVEESYSDIKETSYNVVFPSPPGTSKNGYIFSVSTGPKGVLSYQASCPTGGTSIGLGILLGSITFAENRTKLPKACKDVQATISDVINVKQGRDAASTLGPTFETVLEQEIYYRTMRELGFSDEQIDQKLQAVHSLRQQHVARKKVRPLNVVQRQQPTSGNQVTQQTNVPQQGTREVQSTVPQSSQRSARR